MDLTQYRTRLDQDHNGHKIATCIQCGTCSGSCPLSNRMDHAPRELFALLRDGDLETVLQSNTPWFCVSCFQCTVRCPKQIPVTDIMYGLKQIALEAGSAPAAHKIPDLYRAFEQVVDRNGRISEAAIMARYGRRHPGDAVRQLPLALRLLQKGRLEMRPARIAATPKLARLLQPFQPNQSGEAPR